MPSAANLQPDTARFFGLFVGKSGSGKTVAECSFPKPMKVFDFDGRIQGILGAPWIDRSKIEYEYYPPVTKATDKLVFQKVNADLEVLMNQCERRICPYQTLVLDSLTSETYAFVRDSIQMTHQASDGNKKQKGKYLGPLSMAGPEDYGFESKATSDVLSFFRALPIPNIIISAHIVDRYGKPPGEDNDFADKIVIGEQLSIRQKIGENIGIYFNHVFRFDKAMNQNKEIYTVRFRSDMARTAFASLPEGEVDITKKDFYKLLMEYIKNEPSSVSTENNVDKLVVQP